MVDLQYPALVREARSLLDQRRHHDCRAICQRLLKIRKHDPEALMMIARIEAVEGRREEAIRQMQQYVQRYRRDVGGRLFLAALCTDVGRHAEAVTQYEKVLKLAPANADAIRGLAHALDRGGEPEKARTFLDPYLQNGTATPAMALVYATVQMNSKDYPRALEVAEAFADREDAEEGTRAGLWYVVGQSYERLGEADKAFEAYQRANTFNRPRFDPDEFDRETDAIIETFSEENVARLPRAESNDQSMIFLACLPRSGSTLVERILGSHPHVHSAGENRALTQMISVLNLKIGSNSPYPANLLDLDQDDVNRLSGEYLAAIRTLNRTAKRFTNKHLANWRHIGLISLLMPGARIIDLRRERFDHSLACYMINLGPAYPYSFDLTHIARARISYERIMEHWHSVLGTPILRINYEDLVADQETWSRRLLEFVRLDWHENVLRFHEVGEKKGSAAPTLSYAQVRQPIYRTSVGRAQKFEKYLDPLREAFAASPESPETS